MLAEFIQADATRLPFADDTFANRAAWFSIRSAEAGRRLPLP